MKQELPNYRQNIEHEAIAALVALVFCGVVAIGAVWAAVFMLSGFFR